MGKIEGFDEGVQMFKAIKMLIYRQNGKNMLPTDR